MCHFGWHNLCCLQEGHEMISDARRGNADTNTNVQWTTSLWTAARGAQVINCELIVPRSGPAIIRCGYGPETIIRSQCIASSEAAAVVAETWKTALLAQGFRLDPSKAGN
jgi:hypothetical protein